jgi:hypothetical protein
MSCTTLSLFTAAEGVGILEVKSYGKKQSTQMYPF